MKTAWMVLALALGTMTATAAPSVALFVQNRAGAQLDGQLDAFQDLIGTRLSDAGFEVIRYQDVLDRFVESRGAEAGQELRQAVEALQTAKAEGTVDGPSREASALRTAQLMGADFLVMASLVSLGENQKNVLAYGTQQEIAAEQLVGLAVERAPDAVGQEADAGQARHRDHDRQPEQVQFARAQVAQHHAEGEAQRSHHRAALTSRHRAGAAPARTSRPRQRASPRR